MSELMSMPFMQIAAGIGVPTTYLALGSVLAVLVLLTLWREMVTTHSSEFFPRSIAALAFVASRIVVVLFMTTLVADNVAPPLLYVVLNLLCLYLAAASIPKAIRSAEDWLPALDRDPVEEALERRKSMHYQMAIFGMIGALAYIVVPHVAALGESVTGFVNVVCVAATLRVVLELVRVARRARTELRHALGGLVATLTISWLLVIAASTFAGSLSHHLLQAARATDIAALVLGLFALQTTYVLQGVHHRNLALDRHEEAEKMKEELSLLNRVASDLYEDSNSLIQRQQDRFRELLGKNESLEKILQIGIRIQRHKNPNDMLEMVASLIRDELGFKTVIIRLLNERTQSFETRAYVGVNPDAEEAVQSHRLPMSEYQQMIEPRFRIGSSYFLKNLTPARRATKSQVGEASVLVSDHWNEIDRLLVPLYDDGAEGRTIGYISVEEPEGAHISIVEAIDNLEIIATLTVIAIRNTLYVRDIHEKSEKLKQYAEKLAGLNKMKSNFVATVSHEFRTPLTSIKAYCETLLKNADKVDRNILKEFLVVIDEESDRLMSLVEDILDFSQMESGAARLEKAACDIAEIVNSSLKELHRHFEKKGITVRSQVPDTPIPVRGERELMKQLVTNLLHNAAKFTPENGNVRVRVERENVATRITVEDDGIGVPEDQIERIFDHFHQVDNSSTRKHGGTGMGLAVCKNIVDWHDGKIWVENAPGRGARFIVVIPKKHVVVRGQVMGLEGTMRRYEVERYLEVVVEMVAELLAARTASLMLIDPATGELRIESAIGLEEGIVENTRILPGEGIAGRVVMENQSFLVEDIEHDTRVNMRNNDYIYESRSFISVPVAVDNRVLGVINVANPLGKSSFDAGDGSLLELFAERVGQALTSLRHFTDTSREFEEIRTAFKSMLDARRYVDDQSATSMAAVLDNLSRRLGLSAESAAQLRYAFSVYDLGLAHVGYNIIKQPKELSVRDRQHVEQHTIIGTELLSSVENDPAIRDAVLYHHENFDGSGYPGRLKGEDIPLLARVIRLADTFRALISHRPYQKQYSVAEALDVIRQRSGTYFDPVVVKAFTEAATENMDLLKNSSAEIAREEEATAETRS